MWVSKKKSTEGKPLDDQLHRNRANICSQKFVEVDDEHKLCICYEKHMATKVAIGILGEEWKVMYSRSGLQKTNKVSPLSRVSGTKAMYAFY